MQIEIFFCFQFIKFHISVIDLKANNLMVPGVTTGETYFLVTWSNPTTVNFNNKYQLIISFGGQQETPFEITKSKTNHNVTSRTPGRKYRIILRSIETASRPTQQTTEVEIMDGCSKLNEYKIMFVNLL